MHIQSFLMSYFTSSVFVPGSCGFAVADSSPHSFGIGKVGIHGWEGKVWYANGCIHYIDALCIHIVWYLDIERVYIYLNVLHLMYTWNRYVLYFELSPSKAGMHVNMYTAIFKSMYLFVVECCCSPPTIQYTYRKIPSSRPAANAVLSPHGRHHLRGP